MAENPLLSGSHHTVNISVKLSGQWKNLSLFFCAVFYLNLVWASNLHRNWYLSCCEVNQQLLRIAVLLLRIPAVSDLIVKIYVDVFLNLKSGYALMPVKSSTNFN